jgi:hypothetical protein
MRGPDFDDVVGGEVRGEERERLHRAHDALVAAGPAPALPASLAKVPDPEPEPVAPLLVRERRTRVSRLLPLAAALAALAFAGGYFAGRAGQPAAFPTEFELVMRGTPVAPGAFASLRLGPKDTAGNWPMEMTVRGLRPGGRYELLLTKRGRRAASCGYFTIRAGKAIVYLNAPYRLRSFDGWIVTRKGSDEPLLRTADI